MTAASPLAGIDLNLLTVFRAVDEARNVTRAAKALGISQPALSHALRRMREAFGDAMFVRTPRGMVLTPRAEAIAPVVRDMLSRVERDVLGHGELRPETLSRTFRLRTTDYVESLLVPPLLETLRKEAPGVSIAVMPLEWKLPKEELMSGECDLAIAGFFRELPEGFYQQKLFAEGFACGVRRGHPRVRPRAKKITLDAYCNEAHVLVAPGGELRGPVDHALARSGRARRIVVGASGFMSAAFTVSRSDTILTAPSRLVALVAESLPIDVFEPPVALADVKIVQVWHARKHDDSAHRWLREKIRDVLG